MELVTYIWIIIVLFICSCTRNKQLDYALQAAGENKHKLESILKHFKDDPEKIKATNFLIENMPGHTGTSYSNVENHLLSIKNISKSPKTTIGTVHPNRKRNKCILYKRKS